MTLWRILQAASWLNLQDYQSRSCEPILPLLGRTFLLSEPAMIELCCLMLKAWDKRHIFIAKDEGRPWEAIYSIRGWYVSWKAFCSMRGEICAMEDDLCRTRLCAVWGNYISCEGELVCRERRVYAMEVDLLQETDMVVVRGKCVCRGRCYMPLEVSLCHGGEHVP